MVGCSGLMLLPLIRFVALFETRLDGLEPFKLYKSILPETL